MASVLVNEGRVKSLLDLLNADAANWRIRLFTAPTTITVANVYGDIVQCTFGGYAQQTPVPATPPAIDGAGNAKSVAPTLTFTCNGSPPSENVYGVALVNVSGNKLIAAEIFLGGPYSMALNGDTITIDLDTFLGQLTPPL